MKINIKNVTVYGLYILLITSIIFSFFHLKHSISEMNKKLEVITTYVESENWEKSEILFEEFEKLHKHKLERLSFILKHTDINDILLSIVDVSTNIKLKNKDMCMLKLENLKFNLYNMYKSQLPKFENIL